MMNFLLQIQTGTVPAGAETMGTQPDGISMKFIDLAFKGGWIMIPILLLSVIAVYIFIDRFFAIRRAGKLDEGLMDKVKAYITAGKMDAAIALCRSQDNPAARMIEKGINRIGRPLPDVTAAIENVGNLEIQRLEKGLPALASTGIYQAMVTTVAGLIVGIIAYFAYNILVSNIEKVVYKMEATTTEFMDLLYEPA